MAYDTLEEAQARIVELEEELTQEKSNSKTLSEENETLKKENEDVRTLNQKYFNKLIAQDDTKTKPADPEGEKVPTCEEFASKLEI